MVSVADLGFDECPCLHAIYSRAREWGYRLCPAAAGPGLRLQLLDQPEGDWLYIAMAPLPDREGVPAIFELDRDFDGPRLRAFIAECHKRFHPHDRFVFAARQR